MKNIIFAIVLCIALAPKSKAATLIMKDGKTMSKVKVVSINFQKKLMVVERDGQQRNVSTNRIKEFYSNDIDTGGNVDIDNTIDYKVSIMSVKMPKTGYEKSSKKKSRNKTSDCEISYSITRDFKNKDKNTNPNVIKRPYFYLAVLTEGSSRYGGRPIFRYTFPSKEFKLDSKSKKSYNTAAIMEEVLSFKRHRFHFNQSASFNSHSSSRGLGGELEAKIELKGIKSRRIIAYHLEVWGKNAIVGKKDWIDGGVHLDSKWAQRWWMGN